ncbi:MAG: DUF1684 domain-containing protein [Gemmatimonadales bacterium]
MTQVTGGRLGHRWVTMLVLASCPLSSMAAQQGDDLERERHEYAAWLATAPLSPFALLRIQPVGDGISIGREPSDIPLPGIGRGMAREEGTVVVFRRDSNRVVLPRGRPVPVGAFTLIASGLPGRSVIAAFGAVRGFAPPTWFPPAPGFDLTLTLQPGGRREAFRILGPDGTDVEAHEAGFIQVARAGGSTRLRVYRVPGDEADETELLIYFRDSTSGHGSYPAGRFVTLTPAGSERYRLDFNRARNPFCAYSSAFPCPAPWPGNTIPFSVEAGEQYHGGEPRSAP